MTPHELVTSFAEPGSTPLVFARIQEVMNKPSSSVGYLSEIISDDPSLSARLLRLVNSSFFGFPSRIDTISRAVMIVGTQQIRDLALATSILNVFNGIPEQFVNMDSFWRHSVATGVASRALAGLRREPNIERFFVGGVVHDIGRLIILQKLPDASREIFTRARAEHRLLVDIEDDILGFDHAMVGRALVQRWHLPGSLEEVVAYHHVPQKAFSYPVEAAATHVADIVVHAMQEGNSGEVCVPPLDPHAWNVLNLPETVFPMVVDLVDRQMEDILTLFAPAETA